MGKVIYKPEIVRAYFLEMGLPEPVFELVYIPGRRFRLDIAFPLDRLGIEVQGGLHMKSAHTSAAGLRRDMEKRNLGILNGWRVLEVEPANLCMLETVEMIRKALKIGRTGSVHAA